MLEGSENVNNPVAAEELRLCKEVLAVRNPATIPQGIRNSFNGDSMAPFFLLDYTLRHRFMMRARIISSNLEINTKEVNTIVSGVAKRVALAGLSYMAVRLVSSAANSAKKRLALSS